MNKFFGKINKSVLQILTILVLINFATISNSLAQTKTILLFGDSIIAGYGLEVKNSVPIQLENNLREKGLEVKIINGGISGDTTEGGRKRLQAVLDQHHPDIVLLALGGNDMLRKISPQNVKDNLNAMLKILEERKVKIVFSSVIAPPNFGIVYSYSFNKIYPELAEKFNLPLYPFLLEKIYYTSGMMQPDKIHPSEAGAKKIAQDLSEYLVTYLK